MAKDPAFLFYPGDYLRDTQNLSEKSQVAYDRIMCEHMRNICKDMNNITVSKKQVNFFTKRLSPDEKEELLYILTEKKDTYQIEWVAESIAKRKAYSNSRRKNREKSKENISETYDTHMEDEIEIKDVIKKESYIILFEKIDSETKLAEDFKEQILLWLKYKSEKGQSYKETGMKTLIKSLLKDSDNNIETATEMINNSMKNNYSGIFKLKNKSKSHIQHDTDFATDRE